MDESEDTREAEGRRGSLEAVQSVAIIGMSLAGLRCAESLRRLGFEGTIHAIGAERHQPYDRPPLSKEVLTGAADSPFVPLRRDPLAELDLDLRLGVRATALDVARRTVTLDDGATVSANAIVVATGAYARRLPESVCAHDAAHVHVLRTLDDAVALRAALDGAPERVAVIGAGFIGMEVAASCRARGLAVTVVEPLPQPLVRGLGEVLGARCARLHRDHDVDLRLGVGVARVGEGGIDLDDGSRIDADVVVVGVGAAPAVEWLQPDTLAIDNGIVCDAHLAAAPGIYAIGDVCNFPNPLFDGARMRLEHWTNATEQAMHVAQQIAGDAASEFAPVPFVWSDQYDVKIQIVGRFDADCDLHIAHGSLDDDRFVALFGRRGRLVGALGFTQPRLVMKYRRLIADRAGWDEALAEAAG